MRRWLVSGRTVRRFVAVPLLTVVAAGCQSNAESTDQPAGRLVAFRAEHEIGLVQGTTVVATAAGDFPASSEPVVTDDGRFVFARSADGTVSVIDVQAKRSNTVRLPGQRVGTGGRSMIVWWEQPNKLMQLDLAASDSKPKLRQIVDLPGPGGDVTLVAAQGKTAVVSRSGELFAVGRDGPPTRLERTRAPVDLAVLSPDGSGLAYTVRRAPNSCGAAAVTMVTLADGTQHDVDAGARNDARGSQVLRMSWPATGALQVSYAGWNCADPRDFSFPQVWSVQGDKLTAPQPGAALQSVAVGSGERAVLTPEPATSPSPRGTLVVEQGGHKTAVHDRVDAIEVVSSSQR